MPRAFPEAGNAKNYVLEWATQQFHPGRRSPARLCGRAELCRGWAWAIAMFQGWRAWRLPVLGRGDGSRSR